MWDESSGRKSWRRRKSCLSLCTAGDSRQFFLSHTNSLSLYFIQGKSIIILIMGFHIYVKPYSYIRLDKSSKNCWTISICVTGESLLEKCMSILLHIRLHAMSCCVSFGYLGAKVPRGVIVLVQVIHFDRLFLQ
jgi:hypothetical protein